MMILARRQLALAIRMMALMVTRKNLNDIVVDVRCSAADRNNRSAGRLHSGSWLTMLVWTIRR